MSILSWIMEIFESPNDLLKRLQDPNYFARVRAAQASSESYKTWLTTQYTRIEAALQIDQAKGRTQNIATLRAAQSILESEMKSQFLLIPEHGK